GQSLKSVGNDAIEYPIYRAPFEADFIREANVSRELQLPQPLLGALTLPRSRKTIIISLPSPANRRYRSSLPALRPRLAKIAERLLRFTWQSLPGLEPGHLATTDSIASKNGIPHNIAELPTVPHTASGSEFRRRSPRLPAFAMAAALRPRA